ncbi:unnamed protein product [Trichogramma brassicae]|uniref:Peptidase S1 domain-containing protein n=1 Tax=Trichogramma brassicae TaxID=86971 RepID=A0A6H5J6Z3_9HYME|nr:unnamed protein product [Trichogramma brassicae]
MHYMSIYYTRGRDYQRKVLFFILYFVCIAKAIKPFVASENLEEISLRGWNNFLKPTLHDAGHVAERSPLENQEAVSRLLLTFDPGSRTTKQRETEDMPKPTCCGVLVWRCCTPIAIQQPIVDLVNLPTYSDSTVFATELGSETKLVIGCSSQVTYVRCQHEPTGHRHVATGSAAALQSINDFSEIILGLTAQSAGKSDDPLLGIVGGHDSYPRAWPFIVAMSKNGRFHCGGAILSAYWILTAAHCLYRYEGNYYEIEAGMLRLSSFAPSRQTRRLDGIILHEAYDPIFLRNDIALGLLNEPLLFNSWVRPVNLPNPETYYYRQEPSHGDLCVAVGWGTLSEGGRERE